MARARGLALRWYERGVSGRTAVDKLLAFHTGVEVLINSYARHTGPPTPVVERERDLGPMVDECFKHLDPDARARLRDRLIQASASERFHHYAERHGWEVATETTRFRRLADLRNDAVHGEALKIAVDDAEDAQHLLERMLRSEFEFASAPQPGGPRVTSARFTFRLDRAPEVGATRGRSASPRKGRRQ
jgi:hypothetical protein